MQPLTKALRRRLKREAPALRERDIDRFERERRSAMQAALREDPLYAEALGRESWPPEAAREASPRDRAEPARVVQELGTLLLRAAKTERRTLDRKADRALARQGEAARPKRLPGAAAKSTAPRKPAVKKAAPKKALPKKPARKAGKTTARKPARGGSRPGR